MASIEYIQKRIAGKEKELDKLNKKLARIRKVEAQNWEDPNPYYYGPRDLKYTLRDIEEAQKALDDYKAQLAAEEEKAASRDVPAILEFLEAWKARVFAYYDADLREAFEEQDRVIALGKEIQKHTWGTPEYNAARKAYEEASKENYAKHHGYYRDLTPEEKKMPKYRYEYRIKIEDGEWEHLGRYFQSTYEESIAKLQKDLDEEANRKYDFIIERTTAITGKITDASGLRIGAKEDLNGYIIGEKGTAKVQTIGAGGYNIQCFHFRTLINEMN